MRTTRRQMGFVLSASEHGSLIVPRFDRHTVNGNDFGVGSRILDWGIWDPREMRTLLFLLQVRRQHSGDGVHVIDCGANIGVLTIEAAIEMTGWGTVLAIEAQERLYYALAGNIALNNCFNARALHAAVGATNGTMRAPVPDYLRPGSFGSLELKERPENEFIGQPIDYSAAATQEIPALTLDSLTAERVDLLKIDVEGMELEVLDGAADLLARQHPILLVEWIKSPKAQLIGRIESFGYHVLEGGMNLLAIHSGDPCLGQVVQALGQAPAA
jgi:FkbM family methyltransferase